MRTTYTILHRSHRHRYFPLDMKSEYLTSIFSKNPTSKFILILIVEDYVFLPLFKTFAWFFYTNRCLGL